jgi:hypothetical protein
MHRSKPPVPLRPRLRFAGRFSDAPVTTVFDRLAFWRSIFTMLSSWNRKFPLIFAISLPLELDYRGNPVVERWGQKKNAITWIDRELVRFAA